MKALKKGSEEGQSKYALIGQHVEKAALRSLQKRDGADKGIFDDFEALYAPGLVQKFDAPHVRDSSDGVVILKRIRLKLHLLWK